MIQNLIWPIILQLFAIAVIIAEFILPSFGILTIAALFLFGYSLFLVFTGVSSSVGYIFVVIDLILIPVLVLSGIKLLAFMPVTLKKTLGGKDGVTAQQKTLDHLVGLSGTAITDLRPAGTVILEGKRFDVVSDGEYIEKDSEITVSKADGNRVVVKRKPI